jgi:hypothetical protein
MFTIILESISNAMTSTAHWNITYLSIAFFSLELLLRIFLRQNPLKFFTDPLQVIDCIIIVQDFFFIILISMTSSTTVIGNGSNNNNIGSSSSNSSSGGAIAGGLSLDSATSQSIQKATKICRFLFVLKIFRYFSSLKLLALALARGWKAMGIYSK